METRQERKFIDRVHYRLYSLNIARTKEFEPRKALETAMNVFWRFGYEHTSLDVLMREMGIARQSLYDTFGYKRALSLQALTQYRIHDYPTLRRLFDMV